MTMVMHMTDLKRRSNQNHRRADEVLQVPGRILVTVEEAIDKLTQEAESSLRLVAERLQVVVRLVKNDLSRGNLGIGRWIKLDGNEIRCIHHRARRAQTMKTVQGMMPVLLINTTPMRINPQKTAHMLIMTVSRMKRAIRCSGHIVPIRNQREISLHDPTANDQ